MSKRLQYVSTGMLFLLALVSGACHKKVPPPPTPPPPPPAAAPSVSFSVEPDTIQQGQSATLRWSSQNTTDLAIDPSIGRVDAQGTRAVTPTNSTTYTLTGRGPGGSTQATARLTVTAPPPPPPAPAPPPRAAEPSLQERFTQSVADAFFDYDKADVRADAKDALTRSAAFLRDNPSVTIQIEGHCDDRGSAAYNLGLGDRRANSARDFLVSQGINASRITTISYGKEKPFCTEDNEQCWQQNRRAHLVCTSCGM